MALGTRIRTLRDQLGLTLEQLAERSGVDVGTISALEVRNSTRSKYAAQIAAGLGVTLDDLLSEGGPISGKPVAPAECWPFRRVKRSEFERLTPAQKAAIEDWVADQVRAFLVPAQPKSSAAKAANE